MSPLRGIPTSRAYWELKAEQVLNRVFEPEQPILVEVRDAPSPSLDLGAAVTRSPSMPVALHEPPETIRTTAPATPPRQVRSLRRCLRSTGIPTQRWARLLVRQPSLLLAGASVSMMLLAAMALTLLGAWNQTQQAIRQERNMLLIERLRSMGHTMTVPAADRAQADGAAEAGRSDGGLPPPPPGEPWMEELTRLPPSSSPSADVLRIPLNSRINSPAPEAGGSSSSSQGSGTPQLVGVVQVPGQSGSAIFQIGDSSTSAAVGESIGNSGWRLRSASGDSALIEKGGEQRRVSISSGF